MKPSILFSVPVLETTAAHAGMLLLRVFMGTSLALAHGLGKLPPPDPFVAMVAGMGLPAPGMLAWMSALAEFAGGLLLALGLLTRPAALVILINFVTAVTLAHAGDAFSGREKPLLFLFIALFFLMAGPGRFSLDSLIRGRFGSPVP